MSVLSISSPRWHGDTPSKYLVQIISSKIRLKRRLTLTDVLPGIGETENLLKKLNITLTEKDIILKVWFFYFNFLSHF